MPMATIVLICGHRHLQRERADVSMRDISMSDKELLQFAIQNGMIDTALVQEKIEMQKREELLEKHPYAIWEGKDGKWHTYLPDKEKGRIPRKRSNKTEIENVVIEYWKEQEENPTVEDIFNEWIESKLDNKEIGKATYDRYKVDFDRFFSKFGQRKIKNVTEVEIEDFLLKSISEFSLSAKAFSNLRTLVFGIFKRAKKKKCIHYSITEIVKDMEIPKNAFSKKIKEDYEEVFMDYETPNVIQYLEDNLDPLNLGILLIFKTGMRVGELVTIKFNDISENTIKIRRTETRYKGEDKKDIYGIKEFPKTDAGVRDVIIPNDYVWIVQKLREMNPRGEFVFMKNGERIHTYAIRKRLYLVCKRANAYKKSPHKIRKTYGSILLDNNIDSTLIIQQMGHTDIQCTEKHYHRNRKSSDRKAMILSSIPEL